MTVLSSIATPNGVTTSNNEQVLTNKDLSSSTNEFPASLVKTTSEQTLTNKTLTYDDNTLTGVQEVLVSGTSIKTVNSISLLGSGNIDTPETNPAGSTGQVQYNNAGAFGAVASGTTGQVLISTGAGTAPLWVTPASGGAQAFVTQFTGGNQPPGAFSPSDSFALI